MNESTRANWPATVSAGPIEHHNTNLLSVVFGLLIAIYAAARFLQIFPGGVPMVGVIAFHVLPPLVFALIHGSLLYRLRGAITFIALFLVIGNIFENLSVLTGFPFGHYYFTELMGPKILRVPIFLGLAYVGMAYVSWILANVILRMRAGQISGRNIILVPLLASLIMTSWDLSQDAVWSTFLHLWTWPRGGIYFGVPISNFFGWFFTVYVIYQLFALYLRGRVTCTPSSLNYWHSAIAFYAISAAGNLLPIIRAGNLVAADPVGRQWKVIDITLASALVSVFIMGSFALWGWLKLREMNGNNVEERPR